MSCNLFLAVQSSDSWTSKDERQKWENQFNATFLALKLKEPNKIVNEAASLLKSETSSEDDQSKKLYFMAYELLPEDANNSSLLEGEDFWRYQPDVNIDMLNIELTNRTQPEEYALLKKFVEMVK